MEELASVSEWIEQVRRTDDQEAAQRLYERYLRQLADQARKKMDGVARRRADEEDVAHTALANFFQQIHRGSFPRLANRYDLWQVLLMLTNRRVADVYRQQACLKRGAGCEVGESAIGQCGEGDGQCRAIEQIVGREPGPEVAAEVADLCQRLLDRLEDPQLREIAALKLEGYNHEEIAQRLGYVRRTIQRKLLLIREIWRAEETGQEPGESV